MSRQRLFSYTLSFLVYVTIAILMSYNLVIGLAQLVLVSMMFLSHAQWSDLAKDLTEGKAE